MADLFFFAAFPYLAVVVAVLVGVYRFMSDRFSYSSFSSQFLENRALFWGSVPWHYGILVILLAHVMAALLPGVWARLIAAPVRLYALELTGLSLAIVSIFGLIVLVVRRVASPKLRAVTTALDWVLLAALLVQVVLGFWVALFYRWGSDWYLYTVVPWLGSLLTLQPKIDFVSALPMPVKLHIIGGFVIVALIPFTRLVHLISYPLSYFWRPYQKVVWIRRGLAAGRR